MMRETLREKVFAKLSLEVFKKTLQILTERGEIIAEKDVVRAATYSQTLSANDKQILEKLKKIYIEAKLEVPNLDAVLSASIGGTKSLKTDARKIFQLLLNSGEIVKVTEDFYFSQEAIAKLVEKLNDFASKNADRLIDVPAFKDLAGISRKYAIPLLEYFDREKITRRAGDKRLIL
jgi:selenocysteine-specific elongation factor